ncbi:MAG: hypothetical protein HW406_1007 [Candidatus Brocadiaceae bacterium]|nr:hypothetical protein [Candidatus Brocadiaceae bacterium]
MIPRRNLLRAIKKAIGQPLYAIKAFEQREKSFLNYHFKDGFSSYPETILLFLTYRATYDAPYADNGGCWFVTGIAPGSLKVRAHHR